MSASLSPRRDDPLNLRPRRRFEDPEINLINFIDVLLVLLIFFMVSTTFNQEGRVKVQLPQASAIPSRAERTSPW
jgi:biopolymer transport protein ExbD